MNAQERLAHLLETVTTPTNVGVTFSQIGDTINGLPGGPAAPGSWLDRVVGTIQQATIQLPSLGPAYAALSSDKGLVISSPQRQSQIDVLAGIGEWPDAVRDAIKSLGVTTRFRWQIAGYATEPTIKTAMVETAIDAMSAKLNNASASLGAEYTDSLTVDQLQARIAAVTASVDGLVA